MNPTMQAQHRWVLRFVTACSAMRTRDSKSVTLEALLHWGNRLLICQVDTARSPVSERNIAYTVLFPQETQMGWIVGQFAQTHLATSVAIGRLRIKLSNLGALSDGIDPSV